MSHMRFAVAAIFASIALCVGACNSTPPRSARNERAGSIALSIEVTVDPNVSNKLGEVLAGKRKTIRLEIDDVRLHENPRISYRIFLNEPNANERTPIDGPSYLATIPSRSFSDEGTPRNLAFDAFPVLKGLRDGGVWTPSDPITVQFVAVPADNSFAASVKAARLILP
jgi:hypothetical protein